MLSAQKTHVMWQSLSTDPHTGALETMLETGSHIFNFDIINYHALFQILFRRLGIFREKKESLLAAIGRSLIRRGRKIVAIEKE